MFGIRLVSFRRAFGVAALALLASVVLAHGTADPVAEELEFAQNAEFASLNAMNLGHCAEKLKADGVLARAMHRRSTTVNAHIKRSLEDVNQVLRTDHEDNTVSLGSTHEEIFATRDDGCVLMPEVTEGPFYIEGQRLRGNLIDDMRGVPIYYDLQIIDVDTCKPVDPGVLVEIWTANAAGVYSGTPLPGNPGNIYNTFGRGIMPTNVDGAVLFLSMFPGFYGGRTPHLHIATHHPDYTEWLRNATVQSNVVTHNGQLYFDQRLVDAVRTLDPYNRNTQRFVRNVEDRFFHQAAAVSDPVMSYFFLNRNRDGRYGRVEDGVFAWKLVGVNMTTTRRLSVAGTFHPPNVADIKGIFT